MMRFHRNLQRYQEEYTRDSYWFEQIQAKYRRRKVLEVAGEYQGRKILEVGVGLNSFFLDLDGYESLTIVEPAEAFYERALCRAAESNASNVHIENCRLEELTPNSYDLVVASGLLNEVEDENIFLQSLRHFCTPKTLVHVNVPNAFSFHRLLALQMGLIDSVYQLSETNKRLQQPRVFDLEMLKSIVERNGFTVEDSGAYLFKPFPHKMMESLISAGFITDDMLEGFYLMDKYLPHIGSEIFVNCRLQSEQTA